MAGIRGGISGGVSIGAGFSGGISGGIGASASFQAGGTVAVGTSLGFNVGLASTAGPIGAQQFRTIPTPNFQPAVYQLAIRGPQPPYPLIAIFIFPLTPEQLRKTWNAMSNYYDVAGTPSQRGVNRIFDIYGDSPPSFMIGGTTGWQYHSSDGYSLTGLQAIIQLQNFLSYYTQLNQTQIANHIPDMYVLEFYDYFANDFWQVQPMGPQGIDRTVQRPTLASYNFRFEGIRSLSGQYIPPTPDPIAAAFAIGAPQASIDLQTGLGATIADYAGVSA